MAFEIIITDRANTQDTVTAIISVINSDSKQGFIPKLAAALNPNGSKLEYIQRLFDLVCKNIEYEQDPPGWEKVFTGTKLFLNGKGDCKKMSTALAATLKAANIEPLLKVISYDNEKWSHIYVLARINKRYYVLDPVNNKKFDAELNHKQAAVFNLLGKSTLMPGTKLSVMGKRGNNESFYKSFRDSIDELSGDLDAVSNEAGSLLGMGDACTMSGDEMDAIVEQALSGMPDGDDTTELGKKKKKAKKEKKGKLKKIFKKITGVVKKVSLQPVRLAFISIVLAAGALHKLLKINLAQKLAEAWQKDNGAHLSKIWEKFGGKPDALKKAIAKGSKVSLSGRDPDNGDYLLSGLEEYGITRVGVLPLAAIVAAATPILAAIKAALKDKGLIKEGDDADKALSDTVEAGVDAHNDDGSLPKETLDTAASAAPASAAPASAAPGGDDAGSSGIFGAMMLYEQVPIYISLPIIAFVFWHYNKKSILNFFKHEI
jgi:hypothetical protein